jgi:4-carboxymuconolactone decarboxylase
MPTPAPGDHIRDIAPKLADLTRDVVFGDIWERPQLKKRDRSLVTISGLIAMNRLEQLPGHLGRALTNGVTKEEIIEVITHLAFYSGWPNSMSALGIARKVFAEHKG